MVLEYCKARNFRVIQMFVDFAGAFPRRLNISPFTYKLYGNQCLNHEHLYHENYKFSYFSPIHENLANSSHENFLSYGSFQTACCRGLLQLVRVQWDLRAEFPVTLQHKFLRRSPIFPSLRPKKGRLHYIDFLSFESKQKPVTPLFSTLCMPRETL